MIRWYNYEIITGIYYFQIVLKIAKIRIEIFGWIQIQLNMDSKHWFFSYLAYSSMLLMFYNPSHLRPLPSFVQSI